MANYRKGYYVRARLVAVVIVLAITVFLVAKHYAKSPRVTLTPKPTITQLPVHSAANNGNKEPVASSQVNQGTATDNKGVAHIDTSPSQWTTSESGAITVKQPISSSAVKPGFLLSGSASVPKVQYRLIDNVVGVVSQGFISVVDGNFSANVSYPSYGNSGRLDVFSTTPAGTEVNEVQISLLLSK